MSVLFFVFVPVALLVLISGFCFVGCALDTRGHDFDPNKPDPDNPEPKPKPFTEYSKEVTETVSCVAYWPLDEAKPADDSGTLKAHDVMQNNSGEYKHMNNAPKLFPCPDYETPDGVKSAQALGILSLGAESIVPGDAKQPDNPDDLTTGMQVDGAFVTIPLNSDINPAGSFTVEAWARPEWADDSAPALHVLIDARGNIDGAFGGFAIWVNPDGNWEAVIVCTGPSNVIVTGGQAVLSKPNHVVLTFDDAGGNVSLFTDGANADTKPLPAGMTFSANTKVPLIIGVGNPSLPYRMNPTDLEFFPLFPFKGTIQDVAIYNTALSVGEIKTHFDDGSGTTTVPAG